MRVAVYKHITKSKRQGSPVYSVKSIKTGKVIKHTQHIQLTNAVFTVQPGGRARVLAEGRKNVHAFIIGEEVKSIGINQNTAAMTEIRYNPYRNRRVGFYGDHWQLNVDRSWDYESGIPITKAKYIDIKETIAAWGVTT